MIERLFLFDGRIGRLDFFISRVIFYVLALILIVSLQTSGMDKLAATILIYTLLVPLYWYKIAQAVKRCHDLGESAWYLCIPLIVFVLLFRAGKPTKNRYGAPVSVEVEG